MEESLDPTDVVNNHGDYLLSFAMTKLTDRELAKDLVQDTFVSALTHLETFKGNSSIKTWLTSILNRKIIDHWRKAETKFVDPLSHFFQTDRKAQHWIESKRPKGHIADFEQAIFDAEERSALDDCIEILPSNWKHIIQSKYFLEKKAEAICKDFNITPSNMWIIIHRSKLSLRECLEQKLIEE